MNSVVHFIDFRTTIKENILNKINRLLVTSGLNERIKKRDLVAVKLHFGEMGNTAFIRPVFIRQVVQSIKAVGAFPFLTDANTLYAGTRSDSVHHLTTAIQNGFSYAVIEAPLIIADGLRGRTETAVPIDQKNFKKVYIGTEIVNADALISVAHFKGHELSGFGGAIKNIGMGCASRRGKMEQHSNLTPKVIRKKCVACGECILHCAQKAITLIDDKAKIDREKCIGCGECILICAVEAIQIQWSQSIPVFLENMVEYTYGVLKDKAGKTLFINFINAVSPACDCYAYNDAPIVRDIGIVASTDPVAIDQASADLVNRETALPHTCLKTNTGAGEDKFKGIYPNVEWRLQLDYAEQIGLGSKRYDLNLI
ncbi:MAG: DUF362 domain-containing protein [Desulfobacterales bacterium]|jgi:hypothetical protein|nr:DUF362 domain-containing protein [Desulfobacterales bacterium]